MLDAFAADQFDGLQLRLNDGDRPERLAVDRRWNTPLGGGQAGPLRPVGEPMPRP
jgi:hypothetical protein